MQEQHGEVNVAALKCTHIELMVLVGKILDWCVWKLVEGCVRAGGKCAAFKEQRSPVWARQYC